MKAIRKIVKFVCWCVGILLILLLALPVWIGPVVKTAANIVVPKKAGAEFELNEFALNPYSGHLHVGAMHLENPPNFSKENCVELNALDVDVDMSSVMSQKIIVKEVVVDGLLVATTMTGANFKEIARNVSGTGEAGKPGDSEKAFATPTQKADVKQEAKASEKPAVATKEKRVQINRLVLKNIKVKIGMIAIPIPTIELKDIGADKEEGATLADVWDSVMAVVMKSVGAIGDLGKSLFNSGAKAATGTVNAAADAAGKTLDAAAGVAEKTLNSVKDIFKRKTK